MTSVNNQSQYDPSTGGRCDKGQEEVHTLLPLADIQKFVLEKGSDLYTSAAVMSAALNYAEKASHGVGSRVSSGDFLAITQGVLRALSVKGPTALPELKAGPPSTLLTDVAKSVEAAASAVTRIANSTMKEALPKSRKASRVTRAVPGRGTNAPKKSNSPAAGFSNALATKAPGPHGAGTENKVEKDFRRSAVTKCFRSAKSPLWKEVLESLEITDEKISNHLSSMSTDALKSAAENGQNIPPLVKYGIVTDDKIKSIKDRFPTDGKVAVLLEQALRRHATEGAKEKGLFPSAFGYEFATYTVELTGKLVATELYKSLADVMKAKFNLGSSGKVFFSVGKPVDKVRVIYPAVVSIKDETQSQKFKSNLQLHLDVENPGLVYVSFGSNLTVFPESGKGLLLPPSEKELKKRTTSPQGDARSTPMETSSSAGPNPSDKARKRGSVGQSPGSDVASRANSKTRTPTVKRKKTVVKGRGRAPIR